MDLKEFSRTSLVRLLVFTGSVLMLLVSGCKGDCRSALDCKSNEFCYRAECTARNANPLCVVNEDCGANGSCVAGRCVLQATPVATPDAGGGTDATAGTDAMSMPPADGGAMTPVDSGMMGPTDTGMMMGPPDTGMMMMGGFPMSTCAFPAQANPAEDTDAPLMLSPTLTSSSPTAGEMVTFNFMAVEAGCGLASASVTVQSSPVGANPPYSITLPAQINGSMVSASGIISPCLIAGNVHRIASLSLRDVAGNSALYFYLPGQATYQLLVNGGMTPTDSQIPVVEFTPQGTTGLGLPGLTGVTATANANGADVTVMVNNQDCGVTQTSVTLSSAGRQVIASGQGTTVPVVVAECARTGTWDVSAITLTDEGGRTISYAGMAGANYMAGATPTTVMTANVTLMGMGGDTMGPDFMDEPAVMSTSMMNQGTSAMVWLRMMDDACGLEGGSVTFSNESAGQLRSFSAAVTPNMASGGLAGCVPIPACAVSGTYTMSGISARDLGGHSVTLIEMGGTYNQIESDGMPGGGPTMIPSVMH